MSAVEYATTRHKRETLEIELTEARFDHARAENRARLRYGDRPRHLEPELRLARHERELRESEARLRALEEAA